MVSGAAGCSPLALSLQVRRRCQTRRCPACWRRSGHGSRQATCRALSPVLATSASVAVAGQGVAHGQANRTGRRTLSDRCGSGQLNGGVVRALDLPRHEVGQAVDLDGIGRAVEVVHASSGFAAVREQDGMPQRGRSVDSKFCRAARYSSPVKDVSMPPFSGVTVKAYSPSVRSGLVGSTVFSHRCRVVRADMICSPCMT